MSIAKLMIVVAFWAPPYLIDSRTVIQRYEDARIQMQGRDPLDGTGLCGPLLPVWVPNDVYYVTLPVRGFNDDHLRLLRRFPNLTAVRCRRTLTEVEHSLVETNVPTGTMLQYNIQMDDGTVDRHRFVRSRCRIAYKDTNGDGVIDENDEEIAKVIGGR